LRYGLAQNHQLEKTDNQHDGQQILRALAQGAQEL